MNRILPLEIFYIYFSPYTAHAIEIKGVVYPTVEHAYQCARYTDQRIIDEIRSAKSPVKAWEASTRYKHLQITDFKNVEHKRAVMKSLMCLKAEQYEEVRKALLDSGDAKIVKHIVTYPPGDGYWDDGEDGKGQNQIGLIWMELREEYMSKISITDEWDFGSDETLALRLRNLVLDGKKTATTDLYKEGAKVPAAGDYAAILDSQKNRVCIIRYTNIEVKPFLEVDLAYARLEGENDATLEDWRNQHRQFFKREYGPFDESSRVLCEQFILIKKL